MVYSTEKCPHCKNIVRSRRNPSLSIGNPFEKCNHCGKIYIDNYTKEWVTLPEHERAIRKGLRLFGKQEFLDDIDASLRRTEIIEYVEQLKKAGFSLYPIEGHPLASKHDDAVFYSLSDYFVPPTDSSSVSESELIATTDFARNGFKLQTGFLKDREFEDDHLSHRNRVFWAYISFKPSILNTIFPHGITYADFIIQKFSEILCIDLQQSKCIDYFYLLVIYYELVREVISKHSDIEIIANMRKKFPVDITQDKQILDMLSIISTDSSQ